MSDPTQGVSAIVIDNLRRLRKARGLSSNDVAQLMTMGGIPTRASAVHYMASGRRHTLAIEDVVGLAFAFDMPVPELLVPVCDRCTNRPPRGMRCAECERFGGTGSVCTMCEGIPPDGMVCGSCGEQGVGVEVDLDELTAA